MRNILWLLLLLFGCSGKQEKLSDQRQMISGSLTVSNQLLAYATWDNKVVIEDLARKRIQKFKIKSKCYAKPVLQRENLYFPIADSQFVCLNIKTKKIIWSYNLRGRCSEFHVVGDVIIANEKHLGIVGLDKNTGRSIFKLNYLYGEACSMPDLSPYRITLDAINFYVSDWQCTSLSAYNLKTGKLAWRKQFGDGTGNLIYLKGIVFYGRNGFYKGGDVRLINPEDGTEMLKISLPFEDHFNPIIYKNKIYYYTYDRKFHEFDPTTKKDKIAFAFNEVNDVSGSQMFLLKDHFYYSTQGRVYALSVVDFKVQLLKEHVKSIYGVYEQDNKIVLVF